MSLILPRRGSMRPSGIVITEPDPNPPPGAAPDGGWAGTGETYNAQGIWTGATMPTSAPSGYATRLADNFERTTLNDPARPNYWGAYGPSFSGANPDSSWWSQDLVVVEDGMLKHKQAVRTRAHRNGVVDRRIESGTSHLWGMPSGAYPQVTIRCRTHGPFAIEGVLGTVLMLWPNGENWPTLTEVDWLEESALDRGRSNFHWGTDGTTGHRQTGFRNWDIPDTGTREVFNTYSVRINPADHPTFPYRNEVWCNGVLVNTWNPPVGYQQSWNMLQINQTESYIVDNDNPTWTGPTGKQIMDNLEGLGATDFFDVQWITIHRPA
jgi:hypothetical protein